MQKILSLLRRVEDYDMIAPGRGVGVSGEGLLGTLLAFPGPAGTVLSLGLFRGGLYGGHGDPRHGLSPLADYCRELGVPFHRIPHPDVPM